MDINGKRILILGAFGQVGRATARMILRHFTPKQLVLCSLFREESEEVAEQCRQWVELFHPGADVELVPEHGNMLLNAELEGLFNRLRAGEDVEREYGDKYVRFVFREYNEFTPEQKQEIFLYRLLSQYRPEIVIDSVNTATGLAYQDIFSLAKEYLKDKASLGDHEFCPEHKCESVPFCERLLMSTALPALVRHIEILGDGMRASDTQIYLKVGTTGTGGMGLNIPYTHSESKPSRTLMSKSAVAGASSLLYLLMNRTAGGPVIKEIKPAALIGWKSVGYGEIRKHGRPIALYDCALEDGIPLNGDAARFTEPPAQPLGGNLKGVYIDTGENGVFSAAEFEAITSLEQMELVTAEDVARSVVEEIRGESTGFDIVGSLSAVCQDSSYRGGVMRGLALDQLTKLEHDMGQESVAFEILGPPRLSKLLWEAHLIEQLGGLQELLSSVFDYGLENLEDRLEMFEQAFDPEKVCTAITRRLAGDPRTRSRILSIGLPICSPDGRLAYGPTVALMRAYPNTLLGEILANPQRKDHFLDHGAVVITPANMQLWKERLVSAIRYYFLSLEGGMGTSGSGTDYRNLFRVEQNGETGMVDRVDLSIGELIGWIFVKEEKGSRRRHYFTPDEQISRA
jgi:hypothetical protein